MYTFGIYILGFILKILAAFHPKIKKGVLGRRETFLKLKNDILTTDQTLWFHCASLGEYEQGLPVFEVLRKDYPSHKIILSFFSPSGYEIRKHSKVADLVVYLPLDTKKNAIKFIELTHPDLVVFVKYDIWPNLLKQVKAHQIRAILISARFRKTQAYFKCYGNRLRQSLFAFEHIFVQDEKSHHLLKSIGFNSSTISGDTRYDRVYNQLQQNNQLDFIEAFKGSATCIVIGSSWPEDESILIPYINERASAELKFIIAPHEIHHNHIQSLISKLQVKSIKKSEVAERHLEDFKVLIVDNVGLLSKIYGSASIAYVGGAMGSTGLHNILEPAVFGVPIIIGQNYDRFPEAKAMIETAGVTSVKNTEELSTVLNTLITSSDYCKAEGEKNAAFVNKNRGAVNQITDYLRN